MKIAAAIFMRDLKRILRNPIALAVVVGICVVPCLYAWINVLANWNPYQNTGSVPIAVANEDQSVKLKDLGDVCVGDLLVAALEDNESIDWQFMDKRTAKEGVRSGTYYAAIVIPSDFTRDLTGVLDGKVKKAKLTYYVNEKVNPIAPKVADTGASTVEKQLDNQFVAKVGEVVTKKLGHALQSVIAESHGLLDEESASLAKVQTSLEDVSSQLSDLSTSLQSAKTALEGAATELEPLQGLGARVSGNLQDALNDLDKTRADASAFTLQLNGSLDRASGTLSALSSTASYDVSAIAGNIAHAQTQVAAAVQALENDLTDNRAMISTIDDALAVTATIDDGNVSSAALSIQTQLGTERDLLVQITDQQASKLDELKALAQKLNAAALEVKSLSTTLNDNVQRSTGTLQNVRTDTAATALLQIGSALDRFASVGSQLQTAAQLIDPVVAQTVSLANEFASTLGQTDEALAGTRESAADLAQEVIRLEDELSAIRSSKAWAMAQSLAPTDATGVKEFLTNPVQINQIGLFPVENYASGVAPFFTSLALWVGGIALVAIFKLEVDEDEVGKLRPWQAYFGRWLLFVLIGLLQAITCCVGDLLIGIQCAHPWAFFLSAIVASFAFVNVIYALSVAFKHLGKALAFTLVILQVPGSSGMYPIEMMPSFFKAIGPWLPFTYSNNAMREAIGGLYGMNLPYDLCMLLLFVVPSILVGVTARNRLVNVNALFDRRLRETDHLMVSEPVSAVEERYRLSTVVKAYLAPEEYREEFDRRVTAFEKAYPSLVRRGILLLLLLPLGAFVLMLALDAPLATIAVFVISLIVIYVFLILVEYFHDRIQQKRTLTELSSTELKAVLAHTLRGEVMPLAPIDAILGRREARRHSGASDAHGADGHGRDAHPSAPRDAQPTGSMKGGDAQ